MITLDQKQTRAFKQEAASKEGSGNGTSWFGKRDCGEKRGNKGEAAQSGGGGNGASVQARAGAGGARGIMSPQHTRPSSTERLEGSAEGTLQSVGFFPQNSWVFPSRGL